MLSKKKRCVEVLIVSIVLVFVFVVVGIFTYPNNFNSENDMPSLSGFSDTGKKCVIDNVEYDVVVDDFSGIVYLMNPDNDSLSVIYDKKREPCTYKEYCERELEQTRSI